MKIKIEILGVFGTSTADVEFDWDAKNYRATALSIFNDMLNAAGVFDDDEVDDDDNDDG
jgi:hypothetical protein